MPYGISNSQSDCSGWATVKKNSDGSFETVACHDSKQAAIDQMVAVSISEKIEPIGDVSRRSRDDEVVVVDLDETMVTKSRYPIRDVVDAVNRLAHRVFIVTGREEAQREQTLDDLEFAGIGYDALFMMPDVDDDIAAYKRATIENLMREFEIVAFVDDNDANRAAVESLGVYVMTPDEFVAAASEAGLFDDDESDDDESDEDEFEMREVNRVAPGFMAASARRGLRLHEEGESGDGLMPATVADARRMANGEPLSEAKWRRIPGWIARHMMDLDAVDGDEITPGLVAMLLWGGGSSKSSARRAQAYAERVVARLEGESRFNPQQPRDEDGQWTSTGGGGGGSDAPSGSAPTVKPAPQKVSASTANQVAIDKLPLSTRKVTEAEIKLKKDKNIMTAEKGQLGTHGNWQVLDGDGAHIGSLRQERMKDPIYVGGGQGTSTRYIAQPRIRLTEAAKQKVGIDRAIGLKSTVSGSTKDGALRQLVNRHNMIVQLNADNPDSRSATDDDELRYDPLQPRAPDGKWTSGGGGFSSGSVNTGESGGGAAGGGSSGGSAGTAAGGAPRPGMGDIPLDSDTVAAMRGGSAEKHLVTMPDGSVQFTPERQALHDKIVRDTVDGVPPSANPTFHMMGGGAAAGKSSMVRSGAVDVPGEGKAVQLNVDHTRTKLPEYGSMTAAGDKSASAFTHEEASYVTKRAQAAAFERRQDAVLDGTGDSSEASLTKKITTAQANGYEVKGYYATVPVKVAIERSDARGSDPNSPDFGRFVPHAVIEAQHKSVSAVLPKVAGKFDSVVLYDTSSGASPRLLMEGGKGKITIVDQAGYDTFKAIGGGG